MGGYWVIHPHPAHSFHTDISPAWVTGCTIHHRALVTEIEVLSFGYTVQFTLVLRWNMSHKMQTQELILMLWKAWGKNTRSRNFEKSFSCYNIGLSLGSCHISTSYSNKIPQQLMSFGP